MKHPHVEPEVIEDRRLHILQLLNEATSYSAADHVICDALREMSSHRVSIDRVRTDLAWLHEQGAITIKEMDESCWVVSLTGYGADAVIGATWIPGVKRPSSPNNMQEP